MVDKTTGPQGEATWQLNNPTLEKMLKSKPATWNPTASSGATANLGAKNPEDHKSVSGRFQQNNYGVQGRIQEQIADSSCCTHLSRKLHHHRQDCQ